MSYFAKLSVRARSLATLRRETGRVNIPFYRVPKVPKHQRVGNIGKGGEDKCPSVENVPPLQMKPALLCRGASYSCSGGNSFSWSFSRRLAQIHEERERLKKLIKFGMREEQLKKKAKELAEGQLGSKSAEV